MMNLYFVSMGAAIMLLNLIQSIINGGDVRSQLIEFLLAVPVILLSLSFHEFGHAWAANKCGDPTAKYLGRLTLNPMKHLDPTGTVMMLIAGFGYARPVPVNPNNYRNPRRDDFFVSIAGITCNLILVVLGMVLFGLCDYFYSVQGVMWLASDGASYMLRMLVDLVWMNMSLAAFNLLPVPPLDGYHVFNDLLFGRRLFAPELASRIGMGLLFVLLMTGMLDKWLSFVTSHSLSFINSLIQGVFRLFGMV